MKTCKIILSKKIHSYIKSTHIIADKYFPQQQVVRRAEKLNVVNEELSSDKSISMHMF